MKKMILVLMGGISGEKEISILSGRACVKALRKKKYKVRVLDPKGNFINEIRKIKPKIVFNALHGRFGEDGYIQSILEAEKIKYTHSGVLASSIAMDKEVSKKIFIDKKINTPKFFIHNYNNSSNIYTLIKKSKINFPIVIKPINEGSSIGVYICTKKNLNKNLEKLRKYNRIMVEKYIPGREIQVAVMNNKALGAIELKPKRKFYDYYAKYSNKAKTKHLMPAPLESKRYKEILRIAKKAHISLGCKGITRSDFRYNNKKFFLLEVNTQPGMTSLSLVPEIAAYKGIKFEELVEWMVKDAAYNK